MHRWKRCKKYASPSLFRDFRNIRYDVIFDSTSSMLRDILKWRKKYTYRHRCNIHHSNWQMLDIEQHGKNTSSHRPQNFVSLLLSRDSIQGHKCHLTFYHLLYIFFFLTFCMPKRFNASHFILPIGSSLFFANFFFFPSHRNYRTNTGWIFLSFKRQTKQQKQTKKS